MPFLTYKSNSRAFTLIELLVVILIIAILVAVALPNFLSQQDKAKDSAAVQNLAVAERTLKAITVNKDQNIPVDVLAQANASETDKFTDNLADLESDPNKVYISRSSDSAAVIISKSKSGRYFTSSTTTAARTFARSESNDSPVAETPQQWVDNNKTKFATVLYAVSHDVTATSGANLTDWNTLKAAYPAQLSGIVNHVVIARSDDPNYSDFSQGIDVYTQPNTIAIGVDIPSGGAGGSMVKLPAVDASQGAPCLGTPNNVSFGMGGVLPVPSAAFGGGWNFCNASANPAGSTAFGSADFTNTTLFGLADPF